MLQVTDETETKKGSCDLTESLVASYLGRNPRSLPSTLLWDDVGLDIYEQITQSPDYYLTRAESEIIRDNVQAIVAAIGANGIILEMGSGSLGKTSIILCEIARQEIPVTYIALDLCQDSLDKSLRDLRRDLNYSPWVSCHSLCMTYEQGVAWLATQTHLRSRKVTIMWLGSSLGNEPRGTFQELMKGMSGAFKSGRGAGGPPQFLLGLDGTKNAALVSRAYDVRGGLSRAFIMNGLERANRELGAPLFPPSQWAFAGAWDPEAEAYRTCVRSLVDQEVTVGGQRFHIVEGERVQLIQSRKLTCEQFSDWLSGVPVKTSQIWRHPTIGYNLYLLSGLENTLARV